MKIPDLNVLINAANPNSPFHTTAKQWFEDTYNAYPDSHHRIGYAWVALLGFIRLTTRTGILQAPLAIETCLTTLDKLVNHPAATIIQPTERHIGIVGRLLLGAGTAGNLTTDAHLAALAIEHNAELVTFDRDFQRFAGLHVTLLKA
jgi:uncharacterized protein